MTTKGQGRKSVFSKLNQQQTGQIITWVDNGESLKEITPLVKQEYHLL